MNLDAFNGMPWWMTLAAMAAAVVIALLLLGLVGILISMGWTQVTS